MTKSTHRPTKPFRLSNHADFPHSIPVPDAILASFNGRVQRGGPGECWLYQPRPVVKSDGTAPDPRRYFVISWIDQNGWHQSIPAHRLALLQEIGPIPSGLLACHACNTPACMNPRHLYAGTHRQNTEDHLRAKRIAALTEGRKALVVIPMRRRLVCDAVVVSQAA